MLMACEQLMIDISCIVEDELNGIISQTLTDVLIKRLCDAVETNFSAQKP